MTRFHSQKDNNVTDTHLHNLPENETVKLALVEAGEQVDDTEFLVERFGVNEDYDVIDRLHPKGPRGDFLPEFGDHKDQRSLREKILWQRLGALVDDLIINLEPEQTSHDGDKYQPWNEKEVSPIWSALHAAICASVLNTLEPSIAIQNRFDGTLGRKKKSLQEVTSLSLFRDDVERLLRDLYGNIHNDAMDKVLDAILCLVQGFTRWVRPALYLEHQQACDWDYILGVGVPNGYGNSGSDHGRAHAALRELIAHVREVRNNPSAFSKYTVEFATRRVQEFVNVDQVLAEIDAAS